MMWRKLIVLGTFFMLALALGSAQASASRDPAYHPFDSYSPWNTPIGDEATYAAETSPDFDPNNGSNFNYASWTHPLSIAVPTDPVRDMYTSSGVFWSMRVTDSVDPDAESDGHMHFVDENHEYVMETYKAKRDGNLNLSVSGHARNYLDGTGISDTWHGTRAYGGSAVAGLIRPGELENGIGHVLASAVKKTALNKNGPNGKPYTWPASSADNFWNQPYPNGYNDNGNVYMGSLLAIPPSVDIDDIELNGQPLSTKGRNFAKALQEFGTYITDVATANIAFYADPAAQDEINETLLDEMDEITKYLQVVTNNTEEFPGGPGDRIGARPEPLPTSTLYHWDFSSNNAPLWTLTGNAAGSNEELVLSGTGTAIHDKRQFSGRYHLEVELTTGSLGNASNKAFVYFNYANSNNYYVLEANGADQVVLSKKVSGTLSTLGTAGYSFENHTVKFDIGYDNGDISVRADKNGEVTTLFSSVADSSLTSRTIPK